MVSRDAMTPGSIRTMDHVRTEGLRIFRLAWSAPELPELPIQR